jgi:hypothetical protein
MSLEPTAENLIFCVREMADACCEIETPCPGLLARLGAEGVRALHELVVGEAETDDESVACFAVALLAGFDHPAVVPALRGILGLSFRSATVRDEVLEEVFNSAGGNRALLDPAFLADAHRLRAAWQTADYRIELLDGFLAWAEREGA